MLDSSAVNSSPTAAVPHDGSGRGVHQLGYRGWSGWQVPGWTRFSVISGVGIRRSWQNMWLKRILLLAWLPSLWFGAGFFLWEQATLSSSWREMLTPAIHGLPPDPFYDKVKDVIIDGDMTKGRHLVWAWLLRTFFRYPQSVIMVLVVGLIAPPLISQDIRSRAFLLYFSRPLSRTEYLVGKMATIWFYLAMISAIPALSLYLLGVMLSPNLTVIAATWDLPLRILLASVVLMLPTSALALCLSSFTQESRYAGFAWFAIWILGWFTYGAVSSVETFNAAQQMRQHHRFVVVQESAWTHLSLYHTLGRVEGWVFGSGTLADIWGSLAILIGLTVVSLAVLYRRISAPMRV